MYLDKNIVRLGHVLQGSKSGNSDNSEIKISPLVRKNFLNESFAVRDRKLCVSHSLISINLKANDGYKFQL